MPNAITMSGAASANIQILQNANAEFGVAQKRVSTGKWVFSASDDTTRYKMSETMLGRARQLDRINNNISLTLKTLEATDKTLKSMISLVESAQGLVRKAQSDSTPRLASTNSTVPAFASTPMAFFTAAPTTFLSITTDEGRTFRYDFNRAGITYGEVVSALNDANIGVIAEFVPTNIAGETKVRFSSTNGKGFRFDASSDQSVMRNFLGMASPRNLQVATPAQTNMLFEPNGFPTPAETGLTIGFGGQAIGSVLSSGAFDPSGSMLVFKDANGQVRTFTPTLGVTDVASAAAEFNAQFQSAGIVMELRNGIINFDLAQFVVVFRNINNNGTMELIHGTGDFASGSANLGLTIPQTAQPASLVPDVTQLRLFGTQYENIRSQLDALVQNNPVATGRNLLTGQNMAVVMDEFAGTPVIVAGVPITAAGTLSMAQSGMFWDESLLQTSATQTNAALTTLRDVQGKFSTFANYMQGRYDANAAYRTDMKTQGDELVGADMAEESANMTSLQTRQQFAVQAFSMGSQTMQGLLRLLG